MSGSTREAAPRQSVALRDQVARTHGSRFGADGATGDTGAMTKFDDDGGLGTRPIYSIGAIATMLGVETATLRAWEERYGVVVPTRSQGGQRIYSRDELEQLRFLVDALEGGATAADAHLLLAGRRHGAGSLSRPDTGGVTIVVLLAVRDRYAAELLEYFLRTEGYDVCAAFEPT